MPKAIESGIATADETRPAVISDSADPAFEIVRAAGMMLPLAMRTGRLDIPNRQG